MCKKLIYLIFLVLALSLAGPVQAAEVYWTNLSSDGLWTNPANWEGFALPTVDDTARLYGPEFGYLDPGVAGPITLKTAVETKDVRVEGTTLIVDSGGITTGNLYWSIGAGVVSSVTMNSGTVNPQNARLGYRGVGTFNMNGGTFSVNDTMFWGHVTGSTGILNMNGGLIEANRFRCANGTGNIGTINLDGGLMNARYYLNMTSDSAGTINITDGVMTIGDNLDEDEMASHLEEVQGFINNGWITAYGGTDFVSLDYDVTTPEKITLKAAKVFMDVKPAHGSKVCAGPIELQWTLPEPNQPGGEVTCKVYFGITETPWNEQTVVDGEAVESVSVTTNLGVYYWALDSSVSATEAVFLSPLLNFDTTNQPPIVNAGDDISTFPVDGERVVQLNADVSDECGGPGPATVKWTVTSEPNELNPAEISDPNVLNPTVTVKELGVYQLQLEAGDGEFTVTDVMQIVVYADSCEHAQNQEGFEWLAGDVNHDCKVNALDVASFATTWVEQNYTE